MKASLVSLAAVVLAAAISLCARADDAGPHPDLRALRGAAPILIGHYVAAPLTIDDTVVDGNAALVHWTSAGKPGLATFTRRSDRWWLAATYDVAMPAAGQTPASMASQLAIPLSLARSAEQHVARFDAMQPLPRTSEPSNCDRCGSSLWDASDGFESTLRFAAATQTWDPSFAIRGRAPTLAEMPPSPHANAYFFFRLSAKGSTPIGLRTAALDVWFPYVLDANKQYVLWLDYLNPDIDGLPGTLQGNTLHFTLPAFATIPGKEAFGEIDGA